MGSHRVRHDLATEQQQNNLVLVVIKHLKSRGSIMGFLNLPFLEGKRRLHSGVSATGGEGLRTNPPWLSVLVLYPHQESGLCEDPGGVMMTFYTPLHSSCFMPMLRRQILGASSGNWRCPTLPIIFLTFCFMAWLMAELDEVFSVCLFYSWEWQK